VPITYRIDPRRKRVYCTIEGTVELPEMVALVESVIGDPDFAPGFGILSDHRRVDRALTSAQLHGFLDFLSRVAERLQGSRFAVVTLKAASYAMMQVLRTLLPHRAGIPMEVFTTLQDAEAWLDAGIGPTGLVRTSPT
jgi:hypothetical protein